MPEKDKRWKNYLVVARLLAMAGLALIFYNARLTTEPAKTITCDIALTFFAALLILTIIFYIRDKPARPD
ncbi:MAG: hypothetical protein P4L51_23300 [Puia sp.]|nr:hypothetical protein [Puia sp.]